MYGKIELEVNVMKRIIENYLLEWKKKINRKPLLINGIRQVGKTWSVKDFGTKYFENFVYINFDLEPTYHSLFQRTKNPEKILMELSILLEEKIDPDNTLIFFDEIQACNEALNALKYFEESSKPYYVIGAGSYLGITLSKGASFPVGKVDMIELKPLSFKEFLMASDQTMLIDYIESVTLKDEMSEAISDKLNRYLKEYFVVGGMPEAVQSWILDKDIKAVERIQENINNAYYRDFSKYPERAIVPKILGIWDSIVGQLSRENKKFKYSDINKGARAREYEGALEWLLAGHYLNRVTMVNKMMMPLKGYENEKHFKIYMPDIGLLRQMAGYSASLLLQDEREESVPFKGGFVENYVLQELLASGNNRIFYWADARYEMDYILQIEDKIMPIEVKSGTNVRSKSMSKILETLDIGTRFSMKALSHDGQIINIPLTMISEVDRLLKNI